MKVEKYLKVIFGLLLCAIGCYGTLYFWPKFLALLKGAIGPSIIIVGLIAILVGVSE